jgi:hypothetical protein
MLTRLRNADTNPCPAHPISVTDVNTIATRSFAGIGQPAEFGALVHAMIDTGIVPDFITVDGGEGGTGARAIAFICVIVVFWRHPCATLHWYPKVHITRVCPFPSCIRVSCGGASDCTRVRTTTVSL